MERSGRQTSEFWVTLLTMVVTPLMAQLLPGLEDAGAAGGEALTVKLGTLAAIIGPAIAGASYALSRGLAKGLGQKNGGA